MRNQDLPPFLTESFLVCRQAGLAVLSSSLDCIAASIVAHGEERVPGNAMAEREPTKSRDSH